MRSEAFQNREYQLFRSALGPKLEELLINKEGTLEEIQRNSDGNVWLIHRGKPQESIGKVQSDADAERMIKIIASVNRRLCDRENPRLSAIIPEYKYRFQAQVPDIVEGPAWAIRIPSPRIYTLDEYEQDGIITAQQKKILIGIVKKGINTLIVGSTKSGKTTLLNALLVESSKLDLRHLTIQDTRELRCTAQNKIELLTDELNGIGMDQLLADALRLSPERIIIGEARIGQVAATMLRACNTGHTGLMCTIHASSGLDGLYRIGEMLQEINMVAVPTSIARAIQAVIFIEAINQPPWRRVSEIIQVLGYKEDYITQLFKEECSV